jgi:Ser/Thr protein kinase RdoA (MazF antagonist)
MIEAGRLVMIDLDSFCWAAPARDIGNFLAYLRWKAIRRPAQAAFITDAERAFLAGYAAVRPLPDATWRTLYQAVSLLKIAGRRFRSLTVKEWPLVPDLLTAASATLESGEPG